MKKENLNGKQTAPIRVVFSDLLGAVMEEHKKRRKGHKSGPWYIKTPERRKIELQDFKGRIYLVGKMYRGIVELLPFECPLGYIIRTYGTPTST